MSDAARHHAVPHPRTPQGERAWLHDTVLQTLEYLAAGGYADEPDPQRLMQVAADAADELRAYVEGRAPAAAPTLADGLRLLVGREARLAAHEVRLVIRRDDGSLRGSAAEDAVAAVGELLTNVRKHAAARRATVRCDVADGVAVLEVSDDGVGFETGGAAVGTGLRVSVAARMAAHGGSAHVRSRPGAGTLVRLRLGADGARRRRRSR